MKKLMSIAMSLVIASVFCASFAHAYDTVDADTLARAKHAINPLIGGAKIESISMLNSDPSDPYVLRFGLEFSRPMEEVDAFWSARETRDLNTRRTGIKTAIMDDLGYVWLITFDLRTMKELPNGIKTPFELNLGCNNPISGYPNFRRVNIHQRKDVPQSENMQYLEGTPLDMVLERWNTEKQLSEEELTHHVRPLKEKD